MPKLDLTSIKGRTGSGYPAPYNQGMELRSVQGLSEPGGLTQFGANIVTLAPGGKSALRHWHEEQDEFAYIISGALTLVDDAGETPLAPGDCVAFPKGDGNGHQIANTTDQDGSFLVIGTRTPTEVGHYPDADLRVEIADGQFTWLHKDGTPY